MARDWDKLSGSETVVSHESIVLPHISITKIPSYSVLVSEVHQSDPWVSHKRRKRGLRAEEALDWANNGRASDANRPAPAPWPKPAMPVGGPGDPDKKWRVGLSSHFPVTKDGAFFKEIDFAKADEDWGNVSYQPVLSKRNYHLTRSKTSRVEEAVFV